jgi:hypothetical protein
VRAWARDDALKHGVDGLLALGEFALIDAAGHNEARVLLPDFDDVAAGGDLEGTHYVHTDAHVKRDYRDAPAVGVDVEEEMARLVNLAALHVGHQLLVVGENEFFYHVGRDQRAVVVADVFADEEFIEGDELLVLCRDGVGDGEPGFHAVVDEVRHIVEGVEELLRTDEAAKVHVPADDALGNYLTFGGSLERLGLHFFHICVTRWSGRVQAPFDVLLPGLPVFHRVVEVFGHEAGAAAFETENFAAGEILDDFVIAAVFEHFFFKARFEGRFAPAAAPKTISAGRVEVEEFFKGRVLRHTLFPPAVEGIVAELLFVEGRAGDDGVTVAHFAGAGGHFFTRNHGMDTVFERFFHHVFLQTGYPQNI